MENHKNNNALTNKDIFNNTATNPYNMKEAETAGVSTFFNLLQQEKMVKADDTQHAMRRMLKYAGISLSQPLTLTIGTAGTLEIAADHKEKAAIEALFAHHTSITAQIRELAQFERFEKLALGAEPESIFSITFDFSKEIGQTMKEQYEQTILSVLFNHFRNRNGEGKYAAI